MTTERDISSIEGIFGAESKLAKAMSARREHIREQLICDKKSATLVIGAGISCSAGLPSWNTLLSRLVFLMGDLDFKRPAIIWRRPYFGS